MSHTIHGLPILAIEGTGVNVVNRKTREQVGVIISAWGLVYQDASPHGDFQAKVLGYMPLIYDQHTMTLRPIIDMYDPIPR